MAGTAGCGLERLSGRIETDALGVAAAFPGGGGRCAGVPGIPLAAAPALLGTQDFLARETPPLPPPSPSLLNPKAKLT